VFCHTILLSNSRVVTRLKGFEGRRRKPRVYRSAGLAHRETGGM